MRFGARDAWPRSPDAAVLNQAVKIRLTDTREIGVNVNDRENAPVRETVDGTP
jgi:hypothetical protein